jgi:RNA polymerase sigma-70 factor (ECF subfamily)
MNFDQLANRHKDAVYRQLLRACGNREDAEDVLIEALLKAYRNLKQLQDAGAFRAWLAQIGRRVCWQLKEREALLPILQLSSLEDGGVELASKRESAETQVAREQMKSLLRQAIESLPRSEREVYELREIEELGGQETARKLHISLAAMKSRLHRARTNLRQYLDEVLVPASIGRQF